MRTIQVPHRFDPACAGCREFLDEWDGRAVETLEHADGYSVVRYAEPRQSPYRERMRQSARRWFRWRKP